MEALLFPSVSRHSSFKEGLGKRASLKQGEQEGSNQDRGGLSVTSVPWVLKGEGMSRGVS